MRRYYYARVMSASSKIWSSDEEYAISILNSLSTRKLVPKSKRQLIPKSKIIEKKSHKRKKDDLEYDQPIYRTSKRRCLSDKSSYILINWMKTHMHYPYPTENQKQLLINRINQLVKDEGGRTSGTNMVSINNWFTNARRRLLPKLFEHSQKWLKK